MPPDRTQQNSPERRIGAMKLGVAIALFALALPAFAQHGAAHGGSSGSRGPSGHSGFAGHSGFTGSPGFSRQGGAVRPAQPLRYGSYPGAIMRRPGVPSFSGQPVQAFGNRSSGVRPTYGSTGAWRSHEWSGSGNRGRYHDRDRDRFEARRRSFATWYANLYPGWTGYPLLLDPGFFDWGDSDLSSNDQGDAANYGPAPYADYGESAPARMPQEAFQAEVPPASTAYDQRAAAAQPAVPSTLASGEPLTVMFKDGRAPVQMQNYLVTAKVLTDLDARRYQQIPLDEIDVAATQRANSAAGVAFAVPGASHD